MGARMLLAADGTDPILTLASRQPRFATNVKRGSLPDHPAGYVVSRTHRSEKATKARGVNLSSAGGIQLMPSAITGCRRIYLSCRIVILATSAMTTRSKTGGPLMCIFPLSKVARSGPIWWQSRAQKKSDAIIILRRADTHRFGISV